MKILQKVRKFQALKCKALPVMQGSSDYPQSEALAAVLQLGYNDV